MSGFMRCKYLIFIGLSALTLISTGCQKKQDATPPPLNVELTEVVQKDVPIFSEWVVTLDGYVNANIQPQVTGYLVKQYYKEGSAVKKGDVLFQIDPRPFQAVLDKAKAQLAQAKAQLAKAVQDTKRDEPLAKAQAIARSQYENDLQSQMAAEAAVQAATADVEQAKLNVAFTQVRSLVSGIAGIAKGQIGDLVGPSVILTTVSQVNPIKANVAISEEEYARWGRQFNNAINGKSDGDTFVPTLILQNGKEYEPSGEFILMDRQVDAGTGTITLVAAFNNPNNILRPGQFGRVRVMTSLRKGALLVPQRAVTDLQGNFQVAVVGKDNKVSIRQVKAGAVSGPLWVIEDGLNPGDKVVIEGTQKVRDGIQVNPQKTGSGTPAKEEVKKQGK